MRDTESVFDNSKRKETAVTNGNGSTVQSPDSDNGSPSKEPSIRSRANESFLALRNRFKMLASRFPQTSDSVYDEKERTNIIEQLKEVEKQLQQVDIETSIQEKRIRLLMQKGGSEGNEANMKIWVDLVNKRNALVRRQMQLNILEKEEDLKRNFATLNKELRSLMVIDDKQKTEAQKKREQCLLDELVSIVNARDELVQHLDIQEKAIEDDEIVIQSTEDATRGSMSDKVCIIQ